MQKKFIKENGYITECVSNISKMNIFEFLWYFPEMRYMFGKKKKSNIFWFILILLCPWIDEIYYLFRNNFLQATIGDLLALIIILILTFCGLGPICACIIAYIRVKYAKKFCKKVNKKS